MPSTNSAVSENPGAAAHPEEGGFDPSCFEALARIEERHFWFRARTEVIAALARQITSEMRDGYRVLEVGCGTGNVLRALEQACPRGSVTGMDLYSEGLRYSRMRCSCQVLQADVDLPPFDSPFDLIGAFDVLEHIRDDGRAMRGLRAMLQPGGTLLATVPAHPRLWTYFDEYSRHCRRYAPAELRTKLIEAGYRVEYLSEYMAPVLPLMWLGRKAAGLLPTRRETLASHDLRVIPGLNGMLRAALSAEARFIARRRVLPFGSSLVVVARN